MTWNIQCLPSGFWSHKFISLLDSGNQLVQLSTSAIKNYHVVKMALLLFQVFIGNRLALSLNSEHSASRAFPMCFASSISLEQAVALVFCESVIDLALESIALFFCASELDRVFDFFELKLDWLDVLRTFSPRIDAKLGMCVICVLCVDENDRLSELISDLPWTVF